MENFYEHIDDYMNGLLEGEVFKRFEAEMERNASLKKAVENYDAAKGISEGLLEVDMMETLKGLKDSEKKEGGSKTEISELMDKTKPKRPTINLRRWIAAASVIGVILFAGWWVMEMNSNKLDKEYILANYIVPIDEDATKSIDTVGMNNFEKGKHYFKINRFEESIPWFEIYLSEVSEKKLLSEGYFWLGAAYIEVWRVEDAREAWEKSDESGAERSLKLLDNH